MPPTTRKLLALSQRWLFDPRLWLGVLFLYGLTTLNLPFHDDHQWRQSITATIARNFYELSFNPFYPLYDICGRIAPDYFVTEFPLHPSITTLGYFIFGEQFWVGRLVTWVTSCLGLWYFSRLVDRIAGPPVGLFATLVLTASIALTFARKLMPDSFSIFLAVIGTYYLWVYLEDGKRKDLLWGILWATLGVLSKVPSVVVLCFLGIAFLNGKISLQRKAWVGVGMAFTAVLTAGWYFYWMPHLQELTSCPPLIYPVSLAEGWDILINERAFHTFYRFEQNAFYSWPQFYLFLTGFGWAIIRLKWRWVLASLAYAFVFLLFILKTGDIFATHTYYVIPFIPLMAFYVGYLFNRPWLTNAFKLLILLELAFIPLLKTYEDIYLFPDLPELELASLLDQVGAEREDKIMINGGWGNPRYMYYAKRRGWTIDGKTFKRYDWMPDYWDQGLRYIVVIKSRYEDELDYPLLLETEHYRIYELEGWINAQAE
ncbi:MAG: glycosyltransferase family 39 protein [Bacteroidota bacterium]